MKDPSTNEEYRAPHNGASTQSIPGTDQTLATSSPTQTMPQQTPPPMQPVQPSRSGGGLRAGAILILALVLLLVFGVGLFAGWQFTKGSTSSSSTLQPGRSPVVTVPPLSGNNVQTVRVAVIQKVSPAVVQVNVTTQSGGAIGSGVIIDKRGYIVTNNHVVSGAQSLTVTLYDGSKLTAQLTGTDPADDLAVIKITPPTTGLIVAQLGDSSKLQVGQEVLVIGNPLGITQTVTNGIVSALGRNVSEGQGGATIPNAIQTDAPINPGNSGGALVDLEGNLVGIPTLTAIDPEFNTPANGVGFAIPSNRVAFIVPQIIQTGSVSHTGRAVMGISVTTVDSTVQAQDNLSVDHGVLIVNETANSAAAAAGLKPGDVIVQVDDTPVTDIQSLSDALLSKSPGETVTVKAYRGSQQLTFKVTLGELQSNS
ncbi:MAG: S1C family serine protease [Ktedonobacteraceae bacterium]